MYFNKKNNFYHGIMFHHFHDNKKYLKSQGSINQNQLLKIIKYIGRDNILNADEFCEKLKKNRLKKNNVCFTFDDALKCQYDIALPILQDYKIRAFFFVYSSILKNKPDKIEVFRHYRTSCFKNINSFYEKFFSLCTRKYGEKKLNIFFKKSKSKISLTKKKFPFYSLNDIKFRILRDKFLIKKDYDSLMSELMMISKYNYKNEFKKLLLNKSNIKQISSNGHLIGLHTHNHPTLLEEEEKSIQYKEYFTNKKILEKITNKKIISMSHPCGSYSKSTLKILKNLGIQIGFKQTILIDEKVKKINQSKLEIAREDHSNIIKKIN